MGIRKLWYFYEDAFWSTSAYYTLQQRASLEARNPQSAEMKQARVAGRRFCSFFFLLVALSGVVRPQEFTGRTVTGIEYDPERQPIDPRDLQNMQLVRIGEPLDANQVAGTIDRLFASGLYEDIQVDAEPNGGGVTLRYMTR